MKKNILYIISILIIALMMGILINNYINLNKNNDISKNDINNNYKNNINVIEIDGKKIDLNDDSTDAISAKLYNEIFIFGYDIYTKNKYQEVNAKDDKFKISIIDFKNKGFDISKIEENCSNQCDLENTYINFDLLNEEEPITIEIETTNKEYGIEKVLEYATDLYKSNRYASIENKDNVYTLTLEELGSKFGYDISNIYCDKMTTIIEFYPLKSKSEDDYPIKIRDCIKE